MHLNERVSAPNPLSAFMSQNTTGKAGEKQLHPSRSLRAFWPQRGEVRKGRKEEEEKRTISENVIVNSIILITSKDINLTLENKVTLAYNVYRGLFSKGVHLSNDSVTLMPAS